MIIFIILICSKILIAHSARCGWKPYDMKYDDVKYLNSQINTICNNFNSISNDNDITNYCIKHPTKNTMNRLPIIPNPRTKYCEYNDLNTVKSVNYDLLNNYLYPICKICYKINITEFNTTDIIYIQRSIQICNYLNSLYSLPGNDILVPLLLLFTIIPAIIVIYFCYYCHIYCKCDYKKKLTIQNNTITTSYI